MLKTGCQDGDIRGKQYDIKISSIKKIEDKANWAIEEKPGDKPGEDLFTKRKRDRTLDHAKEKKKELKNVERRSGSTKENKPNSKLENDKKGLSKNLSIGKQHL